MFKKILLFCMLLFSPCSIRAENVHVELTHDLAHFAGGTIAAQWAHGIDKNWQPWQQCLFEISAGAGINVAYKLATDEWIDPARNERIFCGSLGGFQNFIFRF